MFNKNPFPDTPTISTPGSSTGTGSFWQGVGNSFTGNLDWDRQQILNHRQQQYNSAEAQKNRDFQKEMSNSAYQRATADLQKAGLNPALLAGGNSPASSPSGSTASAQAGSPKSTNGLNSVLQLVTSAMKLAKEIK